MSKCVYYKIISSKTLKLVLVVPDILDLRLWHLLTVVLSSDIVLHDRVLLCYGRVVIQVRPYLWNVWRLQLQINQRLPVHVCEKCMFPNF
jgi:hypothetical protein